MTLLVSWLPRIQHILARTLLDLRHLYLSLRELCLALKFWLLRRHHIPARMLPALRQVYFKHPSECILSCRVSFSH